MVNPVGSAARMEASVHSPVAGEADEAPEAGAFGLTELVGVPLVGVAAMLDPFEDVDEHPVRSTSPVPPKAMRSTALLTVV